MSRLNIAVEGMNCVHCVNQVRRSLEALGADLQVDVDLEKGRVRVSGRDLPTDETLRRTLSGIGFSFKERLDD